MIWRRMHLWEDYLGWWLSLEQEPEGIIVHVALQGDGLVISEPFPDGDIEFSAFASNWNNSQAPLFIELDSVTIGKHSNVVIQWLFKGPSGYMHHGHTLRTYRILDRASTTDLTTAFPDNQLPVYDLFAAVCHSGISVDNEGYASAIGVPSLAYPKSLRDPKPYIALRSPVELPETTSFILNGMWIASYGEVHGYEYIYIHVRQITEEDFTRPWGAEQNLGEALGPELRDFRELFGLDETHSEPELSDGDLRVGDRIIEAIKLTGDTNVPQGVRTFIGLLDHDRAWSGPRENNEFVARPVSHPWPVHPDSPTQTGMQVTALPATLTEMKRQDVPARGMTLPGLMRVAQTVFVNPKWADVVVHIAGRREIRVLMPDRFSISFGPQINFVIGHNGSGKSAVLSAIAIALGGRTASTGRGTGLKSFIKEGQNAAEVIIILKNQGIDAYRPDVYGSSIKITRRFTDKGSSSYTIKGAKDKFKKTISTKKEELTNITDHMNLQVDNPVVVLTQDTSRQFLASSKAKDKYQFFLNGTSLTQLSDEYESILESLKKTETIIQSKQTVVPDLKRQFTEAQNKYREAQAAKQQHERVVDLEREVAWAHMKNKKAQMEALMTDHETAKKTAEKAQALVQAEEEQLEQATQAVNTANDEENAEDSTASLEEKRKTIREEIKAKKNKLLEVKNQKSEMNNALQQANSTIKALTERIVAEEAKLQDGRRELREKLNLDMEKVQKQSKTEQENLSECQANIANIQRLVQSKQAEWREVDSSRERLRTEITSIQNTIRRLQNTQKDQINMFGNNLDRVLSDISRARWYGQHPVGPLGQYVEVKDPHWVGLMRVNLGSLMSSFAVTDQRDRETLSRILIKHENPQPNIIVAEVDLFDYSRGEPPAHILTPLRVLNIKHEWVVRLLINSANIERTCITNTRAEAQHLLDTEPSVAVVLSADLMRSQKYADGGFFTSALRKPRSEDRSN
ncbi:Structural maintenance of chromosomes protein 6, partial [Ceratobasidium sp. 392]